MGLAAQAVMGNATAHGDLVKVHVHSNLFSSKTLWTMCDWSALQGNDAAYLPDLKLLGEALQQVLHLSPGCRAGRYGLDPQLVILAPLPAEQR